MPKSCANLICFVMIYNQQANLRIFATYAKQQVNKIKNDEGYIEKADFIKCAQV